MSNLGAEPEEIDLTDVRSKVRNLGEVVVSGLNRRLPLAAVSIDAKCTERAARVNVKQKFVNDSSDLLEVVYIFPLAAGASVINCQMTVGTRKIKGQVKERSQARAEYDSAIATGHRASLIEQERDDVFTMTVGNIDAGETIEIDFTYVEYLPLYTDGTTALRLPTVVAPRYVPGQPASGADGHGTEMDTNIVSDASRITPPRLLPGFDPQVDLKIDVSIDTASRAVSNLTCSQHAIKTSFGKSLKVSLSHKNELMDRDFVLIWQLGDSDISGVALIDSGEEESYGLVSIYPPSLDETEIYTQPRDVVFLVDRSGSMQGTKIASATMACSILLNTLSPRDRFAICAFDDRRQWFDATPYGASKSSSGNASLIAADNDGIASGETFLKQIMPVGGTEMYQALEEATTVFKARKKSSAKRLPVIVLITDGEVADEERILKYVQSQIGVGRIFCVGVDTAVNSGLLTRLASLGGGTSAFVTPGDELEQALIAIGREIGVPLVTDLTIDAGPSVSVAPARSLDLFEGRPATFMFARTGKSSTGEVKVTGKYADGKPFEQTLQLECVDDDSLSKLYCRARINDLDDLRRLQSFRAKSCIDDIVALAIKHQMLSKFTSYVTVDEAEVVTGDMRTIVQPVHMPEQWANHQAVHPMSMPASTWGAAPGSGWGAPGAAGWGAPAAPAAASAAFNDDDMLDGRAPGAGVYNTGSFQAYGQPPVTGSMSPMIGSPTESAPSKRNQGLFEKIGGIFGGQKSGSNNAFAGGGSDGPAPLIVKPGGRHSGEILRLLGLIIDLLEKLSTDKTLSADQLTSLESLKDDLYKVLSETEPGQIIGNVQAFLRGPYTNLVEALSKKVSQARLEPLLQKSLKDARAAKKMLEP